MKVYIIAGEPSGDLLAAGLMKALRRVEPGVEFRGVGGESMTAAATEVGCGAATGTPDAGFKSLFDISEISVMGIFEVLPRLPLIMRRISETAGDIERFAPDVLVTVDSWGFVSALITRLRKKWRRRGAGRQFPILHYVAPQVWAWKKGRAKNVARLVDRLMTLLPDEGRYFEKYGLQCDFVGHPVVERIADVDLDPIGFRAMNDIPADVTVISVLPGSRGQEVKRLLPIMKEAVRQVAKAVPQPLQIVVPTVTGVEEQVRKGFEDFEIPVCVVTGEINRYNAFAVSDIAIAKSGTVSLELAALKVPHLIAYKFNKLSNLAAKLLVKVRFANLINIIAGREVIPEYVLDNCRSDLIANCAEQLLLSSETAEKQVIEARKVMQKLRLPDIMPSDRAAQVVVEVVNNNK